MKQAKAMSAGDEKFSRFMAFEKKRKAGLDDYTHTGKLDFVQEHEEENKQMEKPKFTPSGPPPTMAQAPQKAGNEDKMKVFYFEGEDMVKREAMVQLDSDLNQQKPINTGDDMVVHVHTGDGQDIDPVNGEIINPYTVWGYAQRQSLTQKKPDEDSVFHVHYGDGKDIDPVHGEETPIQTGYA